MTPEQKSALLSANALVQQAIQTAQAIAIACGLDPAKDYQFEGDEAVEV